MKILLDENVDVRFKSCLLAAHEVYTVKDMGWTGVKNGALLVLLAQHAFDCRIVADKNIPYQQNIEKLPCLIVVLDVFRNTLRHLEALLPRLLSVLNEPKDERLIIVSE